MQILCYFLCFKVLQSLNDTLQQSLQQHNIILIFLPKTGHEIVMFKNSSTTHWVGRLRNKHLHWLFWIFVLCHNKLCYTTSVDPLYKVSSFYVTFFIPLGQRVALSFNEQIPGWQVQV
jgi:hypothetical protein